MYSSCDTPKGGFPHSEISGSKLICQLPEAYRRLSRLSSPIIAKASTMCSYSLDPITLISHQLSSRNDVWSFTRRVMPYLPKSSFDSNCSGSKPEIKSFFWRNQKISLNLLLAARSALNLYECAVSASSADLTLWIFKEQPIINRDKLINQPTQSTLEENTLH